MVKTLESIYKSSDCHINVTTISGTNYKQMSYIPKITCRAMKFSMADPYGGHEKFVRALPIVSNNERPCEIYI